MGNQSRLTFSQGESGGGAGRVIVNSWSWALSLGVGHRQRTLEALTTRWLCSKGENNIKDNHQIPSSP